MSTSSETKPPHPKSPAAKLRTDPARFDFFQAVRLLERLAAADDRPALGGDTAPESEAAFLRVQPGLRFPAGSVTKFATSDDEPPELSASFGGLIGPDGILPQHYTSLVLARQRAKDSTLRDWLDLFHHRLLSLLVRAWEKNRWPAARDRQLSETRAGDDACTAAGFAVAGFGTDRLRGRTGVPDDAVVYYAGLLGRRPRTATGLEQILSEYFGWSVKVEQLAGQWLYLDDPNKAVLPGETTPGLNASLGRDVVIGRRVWDVQGKVRLVVGPIGAEAFYSLLPGGDARKPLTELARLYLGLELDAEVRLVLLPDEVPWSALDYDEDRGPRLGRNTWLRSHNFGQPVFDPHFAVT